MKTKIYVIYDSKVEAYHRPFYANSDGEAYRMLYETMKQGENNLSQYPEDFTLFWIGLYNDETGSLEPESAKISLGTCMDIIVAMKKQAVIRKQMIGEEKNEINNEA